MTFRIAPAAAALLLASSAAAQTTDAPPPARARTDQSVSVQRGMRLALENFAGSVTLRTWDKDTVRVEGEHSSRDRVTIRTTEAVVRVNTSAERRIPRAVDMVVTVPRWLPLTLSGMYADFDLEGPQAEVTAETVGGDVRLKGGAGNVTLRSVEGSIEVEGSKGRITLATVNEGVSVRDTAGDVTAETVNGDVTLERVEASLVDLTTVNGDVTYVGIVRDAGTYRFATHNGDISLAVQDQPNATVFVRTYRGEFSSDFSVQVPEPEETPRARARQRRRNRRFNFVLGSGAARIELESFGGDIRVGKRSAAPKSDDQQLQ